MNTFRIAMMPLSIIHLAIVGIAAFAGSFADGGDFWSRLILTVIHPVAALGMLILVFMRKLPKGIVTTIASILVLSILADLGIAMLIATGNIKGDWILPLIFVVVPAVALTYIVYQIHNRRSPTFNTTVGMHQLGK